MLFHILSVQFLSKQHLSFPQGKPIQICPLNLGKHRAVLWEEPSLKARQSWENRGVTPFALSPFCSFFFERVCGTMDKKPIQKPGLIRCMTMNKLLPAFVSHFLLHKIKKQKSNKLIKG